MTRTDCCRIVPGLMLLLLPLTGYPQDSTSSIYQRISHYVLLDSYRVAIGGSDLNLRNPEGFDVSSQTYSNGHPENTGLINFGEFTWSVTSEQPVGWQQRAKRLWSLHFDQTDFEGLVLENLMTGPGWSISPASIMAIGGRLAAGFGVGITRSETYLDEAWHLSAEVWIGAGLQFGPFVIDITIRERQASGATLDQRSASPRVRAPSITLGWLFD